MDKTRKRRRSDRPHVKRSFQGSTTQRALVALITAKIVFVLVVFDPIGQQAFDLPKALVSHAFAWLLVAMLIIVVLDYGIAVFPRTRLHIVALAVVLVSAAAAAIAPVPYIGMFGERARYLGLTSILDMFVLYVAASVAVRTTRDVLVVVAGVAGAAVVVLGYAFMQRVGLDPVRWSVDVTRRPTSTFGNPDQLGAFVAPLFGGALAATVFLWSGRRRWPVVVAGCVAAAALATIAATTTRAALLGAVAGLLALALMYVLVRGVSRATGIRLALGAVAAALVSLGLLLTPLGPRVVTTFSGTQVRDRILLYEAAVGLASDRPLLGWGPDSFSVGYPAHRSVEAAHLLKPGEPESSAHSWLFQALATTGLLGVASLLVFFGWILYALYRSLHGQPLAVAIVAAAFVAWTAQGIVTVGTVGADWVPWLAGGVAVGTARQPQSDPVGTRPAPRVIAVALVVAALILGAAGTNAIGASRDALVASVAISRSDARALASAQAAVRGDPGRAENWNFVGLAYDVVRAWRNSGDAYREAASRAPYEGVYWMNLARSRARQALAGDASSGGATTALDAARKAAAVDPNDPTTHAVLGEIANAFGAFALALESFATAAAIAPINFDDQKVAADASAKLPNAGAARRWLELIAKSTETAVVRVAIARAALRQGDERAARENVIRAAEIDPQDAGVRELVPALHLENVVTLPDLAGCTSTRWSAQPASPQSVGARVTFTIVATDCDRQESQLSLLAPGATTAIYVSGGAWAASHTWDTIGLAPGIYRVLVYSRRVGWLGTYQAFYEGEYVLSR